MSVGIRAVTAQDKLTEGHEASYLNCLCSFLGFRLPTFLRDC